MDFDAVVIGSGAGGGTAAAELARSGHRVLVVERGERLREASQFQDEQRMLVDRIASDDRPLELNGRPGRLVVGGVVGGSTSLFGAVLLRPGTSDFEPGRHYGDRLPRSLWDWPINYDELAPYFDRAEDLYGVAGDHTAAMPHLGRRARPYPQALPDLEPVSVRLRDAMQRQGLSPFPLPLAIDFDRCRRCPTCPGYGCPTDARSSSWKVALRPAMASGRVALWEGCEALQLEVEGGRACALRVGFRDGRPDERVRARAFLVAAGALGTPALLLRSGLGSRSDQLGRNHMCHLGAVAAAVFPRPAGSAETFVKQIGLSDFYLGTEQFRHKLGYAQVVPVPGPLSLRRQLGVPLPMPLARALHARSLLLAGSIEDLPDPANRVELARGGVRLTRRFQRYDVRRARALLVPLRRIVRAAGAVLAPGIVARSAHEHAAHQVGTCRFGSDPRTSVLDRQCRLHDSENVFVVDGSFMPTSLGVGPALTIIANALRVASHVQKEVL